MAPSIRKLTLNESRTIPFNKLILSQANVRRIQAGQSIEELAEDIAQRSLLSSLAVRAVRDEAGGETGLFEVPAGGRRYRALEHLVKTKRLAKNAGVPCIVSCTDPGHSAEEDSLAENLQRVALHPLDQFRAFQALHEQGLGEEAIAARFFVSAQIVRQRLKLARVSPRLLELYAQDGLSLEQLMAFTVSDDHARQDEVWAALEHSYSREPFAIRRLLTDKAVRGSDKRAQYVGIAAYEAAGGVLLRDLFAADDGGGWLQDSALLDRLAAERLASDAESVQAEGWLWVEVAPDLPYGHTIGLRRLQGETSLSPEEQASYEALQQEAEAIEAEHAAAEELPKAADRRLGEIEAMLQALDERPPTFAADEIARAGAFVTLDASGRLRIERGYVRPQDEEAAPESETAKSDTDATEHTDPNASGSGSGGDTTAPKAGDENAGTPTISDRLMTDLTALRTLGLRDALAGDPDAAQLALLHALTLGAFHRGGAAFESCLEIETRHVDLATSVPSLSDNPATAAIAERHARWSERLPAKPGELWETLLGLDGEDRRDLLAHCVALTLNAVSLPYDRRPRALAQADRLAERVGLDMTRYFTASAESFFGRTTKAGILAALREAKGEDAAQRIAHLRKADMATEAERLLAGTGWLPRPLRTLAGDAALPSPGPHDVDSAPEAAAELPAVRTEPAEAAMSDVDPVPVAAE